jgi:hypothetical protein
MTEQAEIVRQQGSNENGLHRCKPLKNLVGCGCEWFEHSNYGLRGKTICF